MVTGEHVGVGLNSRCFTWTGPCGLRYKRRIRKFGGRRYKEPLDKVPLAWVKDSTEIDKGREGESLGVQGRVRFLHAEEHSWALDRWSLEKRQEKGRQQSPVCGVASYSS